MDTELNRRRHSSGINQTLACVSVCAALICVSIVGAADVRPEYEVKAAFLLNFTKFIEWPPAAFENPDSPLAICILGDDPFGSALDHIVAGEVVNGRKAIVQRIKSAPPPKYCQVLFVGGGGRDILKILSGLGLGVLTVGEGQNFLSSGGIVTFVVENRRVRFDISQRAAGNAMLVINSRLLNVARTVEK